jgi:putative ABC transport system substrate-binding protein
MRRREFIAGVGTTAAWPVVARAQQQALPVAGFLTDGSLERRRDQVAMFLKGLGEVGYVEGRNVAIEYRWAEDRSDQLPGLAADLIHEKVSVIATLSTASALAAKAATKTIPIVFLTGADPVQIGLVSSLNRPGGNLTGVAALVGELAPKRLELLHALVPTAHSVAYFAQSGEPGFYRRRIAGSASGG